MRENPETQFFREHTLPEPELSDPELFFTAELNRRHAAQLRAEPIHPDLGLRGHSANSDRYTRTEVEADLWKTREVADRDPLEKTERGNFLEHFVHTELPKLGWFGKSRFIPTTEYDDRFHHTDALLVIDREGKEPLILAIDLTASKADSGNLSKKIGRLSNEVKEGALTSIKYAVDWGEKDQTGPRVRRLSMIPRVVLGVDPDTVTQFRKDLLPTASKAPNERTAALERAKKHPLQVDFAREMRAQLVEQVLLTLNTFIDRAASNLVRKGRHRGLLDTLDTLLVDARTLADLSSQGEEFVTKLDETIRHLKSTDEVAAEIQYPVRDMLRALRPFTLYSNRLLERTKSSGIPQGTEADRTVTALSQSWHVAETDQITSLHRLAA